MCVFCFSLKNGWCQSRLKARVEEDARSTGSQLKALSAASGALEDSLSSQLSELRQHFDEQAEEARKQFDAVSHAVHAFADIIHVAPAPPGDA